MNYKEKQKQFKDLYEQRGRTIWISKDGSQNGIIKGRTYVNKSKNKKGKNK